MDNLLKSAIVIAALQFCAAVIFVVVRAAFKRDNTLFRIFSVLASVFIIASFSYWILPYAYPFDIECDLELVAAIQIGDKLDYIADGVEQLRYSTETPQWWCIYGSGNGSGTDSSLRYDSWRGEPAGLEDDFPELDLDTYTYVVSIEQKMTHLTFNRWEHRWRFPLGWSALYWGKAELADEKENDTVYVYRTKKMWIDNERFTKWEDN